jgi:mannose-6-phosphate isomerase-like protein (cupin superfamily)
MMAFMQIRQAPISKKEMIMGKIEKKNFGFLTPERPTCQFLILFLVFAFQPAHVKTCAQYLKRSLNEITEVPAEMTTNSAHYFPVFGLGDNNSSIIRGIERYGFLILDPEGFSNMTSLKNEEQVFYIIDGTGIFKYGDESVPVTANDYFYLPSDVRSGFSNPREKPLTILIMGFPIQPGNKVTPASKMMIANSGEVPFQVLGSHGPTTQFQLLMGTTESKRDKIAAACQVTSLFVMDFAPGGTNIPHRHEREEEIYYVLRGTGEIVAGETSDGKENRILSDAGDVFFFSPSTLIGFYSGNKDGEEHARILAVRFKYPPVGN